ncbi:reverse transcriptase domain-containing protein [Tanacetum coccineum]
MINEGWKKEVWQRQSHVNYMVQCGIRMTKVESDSKPLPCQRKIVTTGYWEVRRKYTEPNGPGTTSLIGFSGETIWPLGQLRLLVTIGDTEHSIKVWMNIQDYEGHFHPVQWYHFTIRSIILIPTECATMTTLSKEILKEAEPSDMTGVPRSIAEHRLNIQEGYLPVRQKKRGQALKRAKAIQAECFLDAYKGYHQIHMAESDEEKMAFHTSHGVYCYTKMPFGLKNAGTTYQRLVDKAFNNQVGRNIEVYVDDLVIKSHIEIEMLRDMDETFCFRVFVYVELERDIGVLGRWEWVGVSCDGTWDSGLGVKPWERGEETRHDVENTVFDLGVMELVVLAFIVKGLRSLLALRPKLAVDLFYYDTLPINAPVLRRPLKLVTSCLGHSVLSDKYPAMLLRKMNLQEIRGERRYYLGLHFFASKAINNGMKNVSEFGEIQLHGRVKDGVPHLTKVGAFEVVVSLEGNILLCRQVDQANTISCVTSILSILGEENVNMNYMIVARSAPRKQVVMVIGIDVKPSEEALKIDEIPAVEEFVFLAL